jgi:putative transposase
MGGKKISGRKRFILVDSQGRLLGVLVLPAHVSEQQGAYLLLAEYLPDFPRLAKLWADQGYRGELVDWVRSEFGIELEIVSRPPEQKGFVLLHHRWVVERTFAWLQRSRRLSKDYEYLAATSAAWIHLAAIQLLLKRLAPRRPATSRGPIHQAG